MFFGNWESFSIVATRREGLDYAIFTYLNSALDGRFGSILQAFDEPIPIAVTALALVIGGLGVLWGRSDAVRRAAGALLVGYVAQAGVVNLMKQAVSRPRPLCDLELAASFPALEPLADFKSFPSGHVASAATIAMGLWLLVGHGRFRHLLLLYPLLMAMSRVLLRAHWPTDTLAGIAVGCGVTCGVYAILGFEGARIALETSRPWRAALAVLAGLGVFGLLGGGPAAVDAVTGEEVAFVSSSPELLRIILEPWMGLAQTMSAYPVTASFWGIVSVAGAIGFGALRIWRKGSLRVRRAVIVLAGSAALICGLAYSGWVPNDRMVSSRQGAFVDFHLHGDDPCDGGRSMTLIRWRQGLRGVGWGTWSWHDAVAPEAFDESAATDLVATEWSGGAHPKVIAPHVLLIGPRAAVVAGIAEKDPLSAVRVAKAAGAYTIVAHAWRTPRHVPAPTVEEWKAAGVDGFEVGNRTLDIKASLRNRLQTLDDEVRKAGLTRWSFSDDHGIPAASPCMTWVDGLPPQPPRDAHEAVRLLRAVPLDGIKPLVVGPTFSGWDDTSFLKSFDFPPFYIASTLAGAKDAVILGWGYLAAMRPSSRLAWVFWTFVLIGWICRAKPRISESP